MQREDDKAEVVAARLVSYQKMTAPLAEHYKAQGVLEAFAGTESDIIYPKVKAFLTKKLGL